MHAPRKSRRRQPRETAEAPVGIGGFAPYPPRGAVTALRVLGHGFEIPVSAERATQLMTFAGDEFMYMGKLVLALDEPTRQLIKPLTAYGGFDAHGDVDAVLVSVQRLRHKRAIILQGDRQKCAVVVERR